MPMNENPHPRPQMDREQATWRAAGALDVAAERLCGMGVTDLEVGRVLVVTGLSMNGVGGGDRDTAPVDPAYTKTFASWMRRGLGEQELQVAYQTGERSLIRAAMDTGSPGQNGGIQAPRAVRFLKVGVSARSR